MKSVTLHRHNCPVCGREFESKRKDAQFCSAVCRQWKSRRTRDHETRAIEIAKDLDWLLKSYQVGAVTDDMARRILHHIEKRFDKFRLYVEERQLALRLAKFDAENQPKTS